MSGQFESKRMMSFCYQCQGVGSYTKLFGDYNSDKSLDIREVTCGRCHGKGSRSFSIQPIKINTEQAMEKAIEAFEKFKKGRK